MYLRLLGNPEVETAAGAVRFLPERPYQLLAYLAARGEWVTREELAALFYGDRGGDAARSNLRKVLLHVRAFRWLGESFESDRNVVRWRVASDLAEFRAAVAAGDDARVRALHRGPLLVGLDGGGRAFTSWLADERERVRVSWRSSMLAEARRDAPAVALACAQSLLDDDPLDEDAVAVALAALLALGDGAEARRRYRDYGQRLAAELGVAPSARVRALFGDARERDQGRPAWALTVAGDFIGRERELEELAALLGNPECRLLTVTGPGGIGKSRLVKEAIRGLADRYPDGLAWVPLDDLAESAHVGARIAASLGLAVLPGADALESAARHLASRAMLLVFDNAEHLPHLDRAIARLLAEAPHLSLLATSRARIGAAGEWLLPLVGLALPGEGDAGDALSSDAARLFVAAAEAAAPRFDAAADSAAIARLVRVVAGMPLAILLAAGWVRLLSVDALATAVADSLDVLERAEEGEERPEHRSVRATFEQSWRLLGAHEQRALAALSVFAGSFSREGARAVADAPLPLLAALVDKSLVEVNANGRFALHPLILQFSAEKLALQGDAVARRDRHAESIARFMQPFENFDAIDQATALRAIAVELPNVVAAWNWSIEHAKFDVLKVCAPGLSNHFQAQGPVAVGADLLARAEAAIEAGAQADPVALLATAIEHAALRYWLADNVAVERAARKALKAARLARHGFGIRTSLNTLGLAVLREGRQEEAHRFIAEALKRARADRATTEISAYAGNLVGVKQYLGDADGAYELALEAFEAHRLNNHVVGQMSMCNDLGLIEHRRGTLVAAAEWFRQGLQLAEGAGQILREIQFLAHLGTVRLDRGDLSGARECCERSLAMALDKGVRSLEPTCRRTMAAVELAAGRHEEARIHLVAAAAAARAIGTHPVVGWVLRDCALYFEARGDLARAVRLLAAADAQSTSRMALVPRFVAQRDRLQGDLDRIARASLPSLADALDEAVAALQAPR